MWVGTREFDGGRELSEARFLPCSFFSAFQFLLCAFANLREQQLYVRNCCGVADTGIPAKSQRRKEETEKQTRNCNRPSYECFAIAIRKSQIT
jgi:hypothetical protein